jgi:beta-galactosidase
MIKAMGLNALSIYIMWNYHEISKGKFDFSTENKNLPLFLDLA